MTTHKKPFLKRRDSGNYEAKKTIPELSNPNFKFNPSKKEFKFFQVHGRGGGRAYKILQIDHDHKI